MVTWRQMSWCQIKQWHQVPVSFPGFERMTQLPWQLHSSKNLVSQTVLSSYYWIKKIWCKPPCFPDKEGNASENKFILEELDLMSHLWKIISSQNFAHSYDPFKIPRVSKSNLIFSNERLFLVGLAPCFRHLFTGLHVSWHPPIKFSSKTLRSWGR